MVMNAFDTNFDFGNEVYAVNTVGFHYLNSPIKVKRDALVRIYLVNVLEYDPINSFHLHANFFHYFPTGTIARAGGVHRHDQPGAGTARDPRAAASRTRASTCSTPTRRNSPSWAGWASSRSRTDERRGGSARRRAARGCGCSASIPLALMAGIVVIFAAPRSARARRAARPARRGSGGRQDRPPPRRHPADGAQRRAGRGLGQAGHRQRRLRELHEQVRASSRGSPPTRSRSTTPGSRARPTRSRC